MTTDHTAETRSIAEQAEVELALLLGSEQSLRIALQWMMRDRGNGRKLSTLRFHASAFEHHLTHVRALANHGGYLHRIVHANPHLATDVEVLQQERADLHSDLQRIVVELDHSSPDDTIAFGQLCGAFSLVLDALVKHGQRECELLQHSFTQEHGGSG